MDGLNGGHGGSIRLYNDDGDDGAAEREAIAFADLAVNMRFVSQFKDAFEYDFIFKIDVHPESTRVKRVCTRANGENV